MPKDIANRYELEELDREELETLKAEVDRTLGTLEARRRTDALSAARKAAEEHGFKLEDILQAKPAAGRAKGKRAPKYAHPETGQTWSGLGRKPHWITEAEEAGIDTDEYLL